MPMSSPTVVFSSWTEITPGPTGLVSVQNNQADPIYFAFGSSAPANDSKVAFELIPGEKQTLSPNAGEKVYLRSTTNRGVGTVTVST